MKRIILGLMLAIAYCTSVHGKGRTVTENDAQGNPKRVIELCDTVINGKTVTDTLSIMTYENSSRSYNNIDDEDNWKHHSSIGLNDFNLDRKTSQTIIAVTGIVFIFGMPLFIVFIIYFFRYKNRKAQYRLAEQALANGQPLPADFFKNVKSENDNTHNKGIKNIFTGIGLFIFFWALTGEFGLGCIGLLIMFTGFGQLVIYYTQQKKNRGE